MQTGSGVPDRESVGDEVAHLDGRRDDAPRGRYARWSFP
jgi:hypothetical protein